MIRAPMGDEQYWSKAVANGWRSIEMAEAQLQKPPVVLQYEAQYVWNYTLDHPRQLLTQYARGDAIAALYNPFPKVLDAWELSNREAEAICLREGVQTCRDWRFDLQDLEHYQWCLWLVSLALLLQVEDSQWQRLLRLVGGGGPRCSARPAGGHAHPRAAPGRRRAAPSALRAPLARDECAAWACAGAVAARICGALVR